MKKKRIPHNKKYGWSVLIVWSEELKVPEKIIEKIGNWLGD